MNYLHQKKKQLLTLIFMQQHLFKNKVLIAFNILHLGALRIVLSLCQEMTSQTMLGEKVN